MTKKLPRHQIKLNELQKTVAKISKHPDATCADIIDAAYVFAMEIMTLESEAEAKNWALNAAKRKKEMENEMYG